MSKADRREILSRVAAGTITPEEAASQLDAINHTEEAESTIRKVQVVRQLGVVEVIGDPTVHEAVAEGPHSARIDGDVMVFEAEGSHEHEGFIFGLGRHIPEGKLLVRMNPALDLELRVQAGSCRVRGVEGSIRADVQASSATVDGFASPINLSVQAGSVRATGRLDRGDSRIVCDAGSVNIHLERGSSVNIRARASMGKVELPGGPGASGVIRAQQATVGAGDGSLAIETSMGNVKVTSDQ